MLRIMFILIVSFFSASAFAEETDNCASLNTKILDCEPYSCKMSHPAAPDTSVTHFISGLSKSNLCRHTQTLPDGTVIYCDYSASTRILLSLETPSPHDIASINEAFEQECMVIEREKDVPNE